ncbi:lysylphosphatidylglycerol synthase domain-containing protein [Noviherbaspirillum aridicola]|uniref:Membrane protein n=1 Tax=Noviherbaspirillum aridicola TaxID=2849687 RepID=A0ABQ4Q2L4_9BURK|nr:lysylphosphatidylglycerol synthase domain-containing protein [Noviherbaspirillum aridicola]GIZ51374.1 membrane protein [Noviherbaspirillum aridicola]
MNRAASAPRGGITSRSWWPWLKRALTLIFFAVVGYLLFTQARAVEWGEVFETLRKRPASSLWPAAVLAAGSYLLYSCFDLFGRRLTGHRLAAPQVMAVTFISYAFNLNMGALVGGVAFRYRLYSRLGLDAPTVTRVVGLSMLTNWLGYLLLAGLAFALTPPDPPPGWKLDAGGLRLLGVALLAAALAYMLLCAFSRRREWHVRGHDIQLPSLRMALLQLLISSANWLLIAGTVWLLLGQKIAFGPVLAVLLVAAVAGVITHVPAGLGVLEVVFVTLLSHQLPRHELLAGLLAYRAIYYLAPLAVAALGFLIMELRARRARQSGGAGGTGTT